MEINAEYLRELSGVKAPILEVVDNVLSECEIVAKEGRYRKLFKHFDCILDTDGMNEVMIVLKKKGLQVNKFEMDSVSLKYSFEVSWGNKL
ncbi:hypothetical protein [Lysinibacillus sp. NPDC086135]|uniref:hypothetical protein n=1 Tax=Lysinibacillus sp. NPDC086135 TaxID=3364130 RepID=UPI0037F537B1